MTYQVQCTIPYFNGLPSDVATNVLHFNWLAVPAPTETDFIGLTDALENFYERVYTGIETFAPYGTNALTTKIYNLADPSPRAILNELTKVITVSAGTTVTIPPEVAVVLSIHAAAVSGVSPARLRGRVYLGCLGQGAVEPGSVVSFPTVNEGFRVAANAAASDLVTDALTANWRWVVYSRADLVGRPVLGGHCDDAFDIQRRRGQDPTIRSSWGV